MDSARHVIKRILNPRFSNAMASYDVASAIHQSLPPVALSSPSAAPSDRSISHTSTALGAPTVSAAVADALFAVAVPPAPPLAPVAEASDDDDDDSRLPTVYPLTPVCAPPAPACAGTLDSPETRSV